MKTRSWKTVAVGVLFAIAGATSILCAQQKPADQILTNGKIITVDDRFSIAQAVAITGNRIVAVGTNQEIAQLAGPNTKKIDLKGKAVVPGFIDNHAHYMRAGLTWTREVRLDGVDTRKEALELLRAKAKTLGPGEWLFTLGGWTRYQFKDDKRPFTREDLDQIAPNNPALLQEVAWQSHVNSRAIESMGLDKKTDKWIQRDASGKPTGVIDEGGARALGFAIPQSTPQQIESSEAAMIKDLNRAGLTAFNNSGCDENVMELYRQWEKQGRLNIRDFCMETARAGRTADSVTKALPDIAKIKLFQGDEYVDHTIYGEHFGPPDDNMLDVKTSAGPEDFVQWGRIAREVAKAGLPIQVHSTLEGTIDGFLDQIEQINKDYPVRNLRWSLIHLDQLTQAQLERMKKLGLYAAVHTRPTVTGQLFHDIHGERAFDEPPLRMVQNSGIMWGLGTDAMEVNQYRPMTTLWFTVTGKMVGGTVVNRQTISREDALIAHTRRNAFFIFQEDNLGSIQPGKLADLVVLDHDYLTVPADQIKDIKPVMTIVGGRIVYDASAEASLSSKR
jgi:predicted amidohydrolase YtcJ